VPGNEVPSISDFDAGADEAWVLSVTGTVNDEDPEDIPVTINFIGNDYTVYADSNGDFSWSKQLGYWEGGTLYCFATDWWGNLSPSEETFIPYRPYY
jgi:hypothetical protein